TAATAAYAAAGSSAATAAACAAAGTSTATAADTAAGSPATAGAAITTGGAATGTGTAGSQSAILARDFALETFILLRIFELILRRQHASNGNDGAEHRTRGFIDVIRPAMTAGQHRDTDCARQAENIGVPFVVPLVAVIRLHHQAQDAFHHWFSNAARKRKLIRHRIAASPQDRAVVIVHHAELRFVLEAFTVEINVSQWLDASVEQQNLIAVKGFVPACAQRFVNQQQPRIEQIIAAQD